MVPEMAMLMQRQSKQAKTSSLAFRMVAYLVVFPRLMAGW
jgi:hypothetical protein